MDGNTEIRCQTLEFERGEKSSVRISDWLEADVKSRGSDGGGRQTMCVQCLAGESRLNKVQFGWTRLSEKLV